MDLIQTQHINWRTTDNAPNTGKKLYFNFLCIFCLYFCLHFSHFQVNHKKRRCEACKTTHSTKDNKTTGVCDLCLKPTCSNHYVRACESCYLHNFKYPATVMESDEDNDDSAEISNLNQARHRQNVVVNPLFNRWLFSFFNFFFQNSIFLINSNLFHTYRQNANKNVILRNFVKKTIDFLLKILILHIKYIWGTSCPDLGWEKTDLGWEDRRRFEG